MKYLITLLSMLFFVTCENKKYNPADVFVQPHVDTGLKYLAKVVDSSIVNNTPIKLKSIDKMVDDLISGNFPVSAGFNCDTPWVKGFKVYKITDSTFHVRKKIKEGYLTIKWFGKERVYTDTCLAKEQLYYAKDK